jgi:hypothetical protein
LSTEISELYDQIAKKMMALGNSMTTLSEYWQAIEKRMPSYDHQTLVSRKISPDYLYLKSACLTHAVSLTKPVEVMKLDIHQMFKTARKKLEPFGQVGFL